MEKARALQDARYRSVQDRPRDNAHLLPREMKRFCALDSEGEGLLRSAADRLGLSARAFDRIRKVARTIADLEASPTIQARHIAEAIHYRIFDRPTAMN